MNPVDLFLYVAIINAALLLATTTLFIAKISNAPFWVSTQKHLKQHAYTYTFIISTLASLASLYLSEIVQIIPCFMCWLQRAFMYPLAVFSGYKLFKNKQLYVPTLAVAATILLYLGVQVLSEEYMKAYVWYGLVAAAPLAIYSVSKLTSYYSDKRYALLLAITGGLIAAYHYAVQQIDFLSQTVPCGVDVSCSTMHLSYWGFYSIPLMALSAFLACAFVLWQAKK